MNAFKALVAIVALFLGNAHAAYVGTSTCNDPSGCGYYLPYEGLLAGFVKWEVGGVPTLAMSIDPTVYAPTAPGTPVTLFSYNDVMAPTSGFTAEEQVKLSQIGALMNGVPGLLDTNRGSAPTTCFQPTDVCDYIATSINIAVWNLWEPGSVVARDTESGAITDLSSGAYDQFNWMTGMVLMKVSGGDTFVIPLGGASPETLTMHTPIPASVLLFGSGLIGLAAVSRRRVWV